MRQQDKSKQGEISSRILGDSASIEDLDAFLVLDRMLMEFSMRLYNVPRRERLTLRGHHRRLHCAVRLGRCGNARTTPRSVPVCPLKLLEESCQPAVDNVGRSRQRRRSGRSRAPV